MSEVRVVECVPNLSEGRDQQVLEELSSFLCGVRVLDVCADRDHHRSVLTFAGSPEQVLTAAIRLAEAAVDRLTISTHEGVHPRIGVLDVLPFIPVSGVSLADCAALAHRAADILWQRFRLPSFFYGAAGNQPLEGVRRLASQNAQPHTGSGRHPTAGAVAIGARDFLIAWNIWLDTDNLSLAKAIAKAIRASSGGFAGVKALGLPLPSRNLVQISINSVNFEITPLHTVFEAVRALASQAQVTILGSELIGLIPQRAVELSRGHNLLWLNWHDDMIFERRYSKDSVSNPCP